MTFSRKEHNKSYYKEHYKKRRQEYYKLHKNDVMKYQNERNKLLRVTFIEMYGGKCSCCGEKGKDFLTIEHKQGQNGLKKETSYVAYWRAIKNYNPEIYEILCWNCNCAKGKLGYCPHKLVKKRK